MVCGTVNSAPQLKVVCDSGTEWEAVLKGGGGGGAHTGRNTMEHFPLFTTLGVIDLLTSAGVRNTPSSTAVNNESYCESCVGRASDVMFYVACIGN